MSANSPRTNKPKPLPKSAPLEPQFMRWVVLAIAVVLLLSSFSLRMRPSLLPRDTLLASDILGKVGLVMLCTWLAWPALVSLWHAPGRILLLGTFAITAIMFIYNPKTLYFLGPFLVVAIVLATLAGWIRRNRPS